MTRCANSGRQGYGGRPSSCVALPHFSSIILAKSAS